MWVAFGETHNAVRVARFFKFRGSHYTDWYFLCINFDECDTYVTFGKLRRLQKLKNFTAVCGF